MKNIKIPQNVNTIGDNAFSSCARLEYLLIDGTSLNKIGKNVTSSCPSVRRIYYKGTIADWNAISINSTNSAPFNQIPYIYSEYQPTEEGNYWHYSNSGEPIVWDITLSEYKVYALSNAYTGTMGSSLLSCSTNYVNEMEDDSSFMTYKAIYEAATIVSDPGTALDNQLSKEQLYIIVLLDVLGYNHAGASETPELVEKISTYESFIGYYIGVTGEVLDNKALGRVSEAIDIIGTTSDLMFDIINMSNDAGSAAKYLLGFALQCQNSINILTNIANDTNNEKALRNAANQVIEIIEAAYNGTLNELIIKNMVIQSTSDVGAVAINLLWGTICEAYLPFKIIAMVAEGIVVTLDVFYEDLGVSIDSYYKLKVTSVIENALRKQINSLSGDYLRRENLNESAILYAVIDLYRSAISKGYEYTLDYLNSVDKDSDYIYDSYTHNNIAFRQFEIEIENTYYSLYGY